MQTETFTISRHPAWSFLGEMSVTIECHPFAAPPVKLGLAVRAAVLSRANLSGADLSGADLSRANLPRANLSGANLPRANLPGADLSGADLSGANLYGANLPRANLSRANLSGANLSGANLSGAKVRDEEVASLVAIVNRMIDPYVFYAFHLKAGGVKVLAGCRWFTLAQFRAHIADQYPDTDKATETGQILDFLETRASALGVL